MLKLTFSRERTGGMIMRKIQTRTIVLYGLFIAVIFLLGLTPLGYINLPIAAITAGETMFSVAISSMFLC